jgi:hypothetical protein
MPGPGFRIAAAYAFAEQNGLSDEANAIRSLTIHPSIRRGSAIRKGHLIELLETREVMDAFVAQHWPSRHTDAGERRYSYFLRRKTLNERRLAGHDLEEDSEVDREDDGEEAAAFVLEAQLRDFIAGNLARIQIGTKRLILFTDSSGRSGVEYPTAVGPIDILAVDQDGHFHVFELKLDRGPDRALGQLARYMGWVKINLARDRKVIGVAVASSIDEKLRYAACVIPDVVLLEYEVEFRLRDVGSMSLPRVGS